MRGFLTASLLLLSIPLFSEDHGIQEGDVTLETYLFGLSYHSNHSASWNEENYGAGLGLSYAFEIADVVLSAGSYRDSYDEKAEFILIGSRGYIGGRNDLHATIGWSVGFFRGSSFDGLGAMPIVTVGYKWFDLCVTGALNTAGDRDDPDGDPHKTTTSYICAFLKLNVWTF